LYEHDASLPEADTLDYFEHRPAEWLTPFVRCIWMLREADGAGEPVPERVLPDGCVETILHLGAPFRARAADGSWQTQPEAFLVGQITGPLVLAATGPVDVVGVRWRPGGAHSFVRLPMAELTDRQVALDDLSGLRAATLLERVRRLPDLKGRARLLEGWLAGRIKMSRARGDEEAAVRLILNSGGRLSVTSVAGQLGTSVRRLQRGFRDRVGVGPKFLARLARFHSFLRALPAAPPGGLAALALRHGYSDQPHLTREFRAFAGESPGRFAAAPHELTDFFIGRRTSVADEPDPAD
jgi:AraC-like DNA-binding protein